MRTGNQRFDLLYVAPFNRPVERKDAMEIHFAALFVGMMVVDSASWDQQEAERSPVEGNKAALFQRVEHYGQFGFLCPLNELAGFGERRIDEQPLPFPSMIDGVGCESVVPPEGKSPRTTTTWEE
jgi:hypothetical protein